MTSLSFLAYRVAVLGIGVRPFQCIAAGDLDEPELDTAGQPDDADRAVGRLRRVTIARAPKAMRAVTSPSFGTLLDYRSSNDSTAAIRSSSPRPPSRAWALVTVDVAESAEFRAMSSTDLRDGRTALWDGVLYGSENTHGSKPLLGGASPELAAELASGRVALEHALADRRALDTLSREWPRRDVEWARGVLTPILARTPRHAVARYWLATAILGPQRRVPEAEAIYANLLASGAIEPTWESWLVAWCHNRLGAIALEKGLVVEAREHFVEAARKATAEPERAFAEAALGRLDARPDGG